MIRIEYEQAILTYTIPITPEELDQFTERFYKMVGLRGADWIVHDIELFPSVLLVKIETSRMPSVEYVNRIKSRIALFLHPLESYRMKQKEYADEN